MPLESVIEGRSQSRGINKSNKVKLINEAHTTLNQSEREIR